MRLDCQKSGFTLVELSISLLIIGLLSGGIILGRDLIHVAKVRAQIKQLEQYTLAFNLFKTKYACMPGDCAKGVQFGLGTSGNGNGILENSDIYNGQLDRSSDGNFDYEQAGFFAHLKAAGFIPVDVSLVANGYPEAKLAPGKGFTAASDFDPDTVTALNSFTIQSRTNFAQGQWQAALYFTIGNPSHPQWQGKNDGYGLFKPVDMFNIDTKVDDGNPQTGKLLAGTIEWTSAAADGYCLDNTPHANNLYTGGATNFPNAQWNTYLLTNSKTPCIFAFRLE